jgi:nitroreductase
VDTFETITQRRAVKQFDPNHKLAQVEIDQLLSLAILSPTAFNIQNWRFVLVKNPELRKEIRLVGWNQAQATDASLPVVLCADLNSWEKQPQRYWRNASFDYISES